MIEAVQVQGDASDIVARIMAEMEEVFGLINQPRPSGRLDDAAAEQASPADPQPHSA